MLIRFRTLFAKNIYIKLTVSLSTLSLGLAAWYKINTIFMPIPTKIPICNGKTKQATNAASPGMRSVSIKTEKFIKII